MFKKVILGLVVSVSILSASEQVCFKLEGKMGEEIKALLYKYKASLEPVTLQSGGSAVLTDEMLAKIEAGVEKKIEKRQSKKVADAKKAKAKATLVGGKSIFTSRCQSCHGAKGQKEAYNRSRPLNSLTLEQMKTSIRGYQNNNYDRGLASLMTPYANQLMMTDVEAIYNYIQTLK